MIVAPSLFDAPARSPIEASTIWLTQLVSGEIAISLCVIAVALLGLLLMLGAVTFRDAVRVAAGCFVLLSAPLFAREVLALANGTRDRGSTEITTAEAQTRPEEELPPANYDPYAGASLRSQ